MTSLEKVERLVVGAGISGLAFAAFSKSHGADLAKGTVVLEADKEIGGYCKTVKKEGFVWDYSGHFFHFKHPDIEAWLRERMPGQRIRTVEKKSNIAYKGSRVDFPFQKNIHQLPQEEFIDCLHDLFFARAPEELLKGRKPVGAGAEVARGGESNFKEMLYSRFGRSIAEKFLIPYNEKLYACDLALLDKNAMGRFFPHADLVDIVANMKAADNASYNASFTYPEGGAFEYVKAIASEVPTTSLALEEALVSIDLDRKIAKTSRREIQYEKLVSSMPFNRLLEATKTPHDPAIFTWNRVLVFNLGFNKKGPKDIHWVYFPARERSFYRIGFYDNIFETDRMSLYVEVGFPRTGPIDVAKEREKVLAGLREEGIITDHELVAEHSVVMDPAYVHITEDSVKKTDELKAELEKKGVYSIGRYGGWTYCSIEDNIVEARALAKKLA